MNPTGNHVTGQFTIVQTINGAAVLSVVPPDATITSATTTCSTGFRVDYYIYGGTPPYRVTSTFPDAVTLVNSIVAVSGGFFEAITNGTCVDPLVFSIRDVDRPADIGHPPQQARHARRRHANPAHHCATRAGDRHARPVHVGVRLRLHRFGRHAAIQRRCDGRRCRRCWRRDPVHVTTSGGTTKVTFTAATPTGAQSVKFTDSSTPALTSTVTINCP